MYIVVHSTYIVLCACVFACWRVDVCWWAGGWCVGCGGCACGCYTPHPSRTRWTRKHTSIHTDTDKNTDTGTDTASDSESDDDSYAWSPRHVSAARSVSPAARKRSSVARKLQHSQPGSRRRGRARDSASPATSRSWLAIVGIMFALYLLSAAGAETRLE